MPANILTIGTTAADSADVVVAAGAKLVVGLKDTAGPTVGNGASVDILIKDDLGQYFYYNKLTSGKPTLTLDGEGTYRFTRKAGVSCGVFSG